MPSINQIVVWIIIGLLGGSLAGLIITRERKGFGILRNLGVGLVGAPSASRSQGDHDSTIRSCLP